MSYKKCLMLPRDVSLVDAREQLITGIGYVGSIECDNLIARCSTWAGLRAVADERGVLLVAADLGGVAFIFDGQRREQERANAATRLHEGMNAHDARAKRILVPSEVPDDAVLRLRKIRPGPLVGDRCQVERLWRWVWDRAFDVGPAGDAEGA